MIAAVCLLRRDATTTFWALGITACLVAGTSCGTNPFFGDKTQAAAAPVAPAKVLGAEEGWEDRVDAFEKLLRREPKNVKLRRLAAHHFSYNMSSVPDTVGKRYEWIRRGILVLIEGIELDNESPILYHNAGWLIAHAVGRNVDGRQLRRLFSTDETFHQRIGKYVPIGEALGPEGKPDCWLVGALFLLRAIELVDRAEGGTIEGMSPLIYLQAPAMCRSNFAQALSQEGYFGQATIEAWREAEREWRQLGDRQIAATDGVVIKLNDVERLAAEAARLWSQFDRLQPGLRSRLSDKAVKALSAASRRALRTPPGERSAEQVELAREAEHPLRLSPERLSESVQGPNSDEALRIGRQALAIDQQARLTRRYAFIVNFDCWLQRCRVERSDVMLEARRLAFQAEQQLAKERLDSDDPQSPGARQLYERSFAKWAEAIAQFECFIDNTLLGEDVIGAVRRYHQSILQGAPLPADFPLHQFVSRWGEPSD
jgi:hypothetical protein